MKKSEKIQNQLALLNQKKAELIAELIEKPACSQARLLQIHEELRQILGGAAFDGEIVKLKTKLKKTKI